MSKQLTLSSILAVAAMASLAVMNTVHQRAVNDAAANSGTVAQEASLPTI